VDAPNCRVHACTLQPSSSHTESASQLVWTSSPAVQRRSALALAQELVPSWQTQLAVSGTHTGSSPLHGAAATQSPSGAHVLGVAPTHCVSPARQAPSS
jgi:hypothetical protein